jgi:septum formation protein
MALVLASASPRRRELLQNAGIPFIIQPSKISELPREGEAPQACAERLAREKALDVFRQRPQDFVLGADTIVIVDGQILGKPRDSGNAARMLRLLSGRTHQVTTGVCLISPDRKGKNSTSDTRSETTLVTMSELSDEDIRSYVATGEPLDKAGAYAIQGIASRWISQIEGDYFNVVGLPVSLVYRMLRENGAL